MAQHTVLSRLVRWVGSYTFAADSLRSAEIRWDPLGPKSAANPLQIRCKSAGFVDWDPLGSAGIRWDPLQNPNPLGIAGNRWDPLSITSLRSAGNPLVR